MSLSGGCTVGLWTAPCVCHCLRGALWGCGLHPVSLGGALWGCGLHPVCVTGGCTVGLWTAPCVCHCRGGGGALWGCGLHPVCVTGRGGGCTVGLWIAPCVGLAVTVMGVHCRAVDCTLCWTCCHCNGGAL